MSPSHIFHVVSDSMAYGIGNSFPLPVEVNSPATTTTLLFDIQSQYIPMVPDAAPRFTIRHSPKHDKIKCREYRGIGEPHFDCGDLPHAPQLGDIYIDMSGDPTVGGTYRVFLKLLDGWTEWLGDTDNGRSSPLHLWHPTIDDKKAKLRPLFYFSDGESITPAWISWTGYVNWRKRRLNRLDGFKGASSRSLPFDEPRIRSSHECVARFLAQERAPITRFTGAKREIASEPDGTSGRPMTKRHKGSVEPANSGEEEILELAPGSPEAESTNHPVGNAPLDQDTSVQASPLPGIPTRSTQTPAEAHIEAMVHTEARSRNDRSVQTDAWSGVRSTEDRADSPEGHIAPGVGHEFAEGIRDEFADADELASSPPSLEPPPSLGYLPHDDRPGDTDVFVTPYHGICWPKDAKLLSWSNGLRTVGPWKFVKGEHNFVKLVYRLDGLFADITCS